VNAFLGTSHSLCVQLLLTDGGDRNVLLLCSCGKRRCDRLENGLRALVFQERKKIALQNKCQLEKQREELVVGMKVDTMVQLLTIFWKLVAKSDVFGDQGLGIYTN
jgi:hypothetical protein